MGLGKREAGRFDRGFNETELKLFNTVVSAIRIILNEKLLVKRGRLERVANQTRRLLSDLLRRDSDRDRNS